MNLGQQLVSTVLQEIFGLDERTAQANAEMAGEEDCNRLFCALLAAPEGLTAKEIQSLMKDRVYVFLRRIFHLPENASVADVGRAIHLLNLTQFVQSGTFSNQSEESLRRRAYQKLWLGFCEGLGMPVDSGVGVLGQAYYKQMKRDLTALRGEKDGSEVMSAFIAETLGLPKYATFEMIGQEVWDNFRLSVLAAFRLPEQT